MTENTKHNLPEEKLHWKQDLRSKVSEGLLAGLFLYMIWVLLALLIRPIDAGLGRPGLLIYTVSLIAFSVYFLEHSLLPRILETYRAWYGMLGGLLAWTAISMSHNLGATSIANITGILVLILFSLTVTRLYQRYLPLGSRFYFLTLLLAWVGQLILDSRSIIVGWYARLDLLYRGTGYLCLLGAFLTVWWIFTQTEKRIQRLYFAPLLAFFVALAIYLLR